MSLRMPDLGVEAFYTYYADREPPSKEKCLAELIYKWIDNDTRDVALHTACGSFQLWLTIVCLIVAEWQPSRFLQDKPTHVEPTIPWHIAEVLCKDRLCVGARIFDPYTFESFKANPD